MSSVHFSLNLISRLAFALFQLTQSELLEQQLNIQYVF